ncbi:conserved hypothetical protein [Gammaproteobacteria bacterium]
MRLSSFRRWLVAGLLTITLPWVAVTASETHFPPSFPFGFSSSMPPHPPGMLPMPGGQFLPFSGGMMPDFPPMLLDQPPLLSGLNLTEEQQDKLFELVHFILPSLRVKAKIARKAMTDLRKLITSDHYEASNGQVLIQTYAQALASIVVMWADKEAKTRDLLTSEQKRQWDNIHEKLYDEYGGEDKQQIPH